MTEFAHFDVLGVPIGVTSPQKTLEAFERWSNDDIGRFVCVREVNGVMLAQDDKEFRDLHYRAALVTPDGMPIAWLGRMEGYDLERTAGPDLMMYVMMQSDREDGPRHFFYGGKPGVAEELRQVFAQLAPKANVVGVGTPPFRALTMTELDTLAAEIEAVKADIVWVGISTPKQEFLMEQLSRRTSATFVGVGAAFDFHTGRVRRAPRWMRESGLEWLHRLLSEPRRLWRRYVVMAPKFVLLVALRKLRPSRPDLRRCT